MGHDEHAPARRPLVEVAGEPGDALDVEVVGRLVEHEQVGLLHQRGRQRRPGAARRRTAGRTPSRARAPAARARPAPRARRRRRPIRGSRRRRRRDRGPSRASSSIGRWLTVAIVMPPVRVTRPVSGCLEPDDQPQQRRLAAAVAPDDADPVAVADADRQVVEHGGRAVGLADRFEVDQVGRVAGHLISAPAGRRAPGRWRPGPCGTRPRRSARRPAAPRPPGRRRGTRRSAPSR